MIFSVNQFVAEQFKPLFYTKIWWKRNIYYYESSRL